MITKRIIPCLDIKNGRTVKGINFENIKDAGDPVELAMEYSKQGADELVLLDITATTEKRKTFSEIVSQVAKHINIPFTVGGGINAVEDVATLLNSGADKVSINTSALRDFGLIKDIANTYGKQCVVVAIDTKFDGKDWFVYLNGGKVKTTIKTINWAIEAEKRGAGEILLTSMNNDGTKNGFAIDITQQISQTVNIPVIASGGAGNKEHFREVFTDGKADAALAASIFHYKEVSIPELKKYLSLNNINIRL